MAVDPETHENHTVIDNLHRRMDSQDALLLDIRDTLVAHIATEASMKPSLDELVSLWKGSKVISVIIAGLAAAGAGLVGLFAWAKDHIK